jgi:hypothetical protein
VQRFDGVAVLDGHLLLGEDRPAVHREAGHVHGAARHGVARFERVGDGVPSGVGGQQRRMGVQDSPRERPVGGFGQHGAEPGHDDEVDVACDEHVGERGAVGVAVEPGPEPAEAGAVDEQRFHPGFLGDRQRVTGPVRGDDGDRQRLVEQGAQDRAGT